MRTNKESGLNHALRPDNKQIASYYISNRVFVKQGKKKGKYPPYDLMIQIAFPP